MKKRWSTRIVGLVLLTAGAGALLWFVGSLPREPTVAAAVTLVLGLTLGLLWWSHADLPRPAESASWYVVRRDEANVPPALDYRLVRLRRDLRDAVEHSDREDHVHALITELTRERLLQRHGIALHTEPDAARAHLSPPLRTYLAQPPSNTHKSSITRISDALTGIEEL